MWAFAGLSPMEWMVILVVGVLLFGKKLRDVGRSLGEGIVEFKRGLKGVGGNSELGLDVKPPRRDNPTDEPPYESGTRVPQPPKPPTDSGAVALEPPLPPDV